MSGPETLGAVVQHPSSGLRQSDPKLLVLLVYAAPMLHREGGGHWVDGSYRCPF